MAIINKHFKHNEVACGIGIDVGKMLATKTGIRRHGSEQPNYQSLVWLGRPANVASKLTDVANKPATYVTEPAVKVAYPSYATMLFGLAIPAPSSGGGLINSLSAGPAAWRWEEQSPKQFIENFDVEYVPTRLVHKDPNFKSFFLTEKQTQVVPATPPVLMTKAVWTGFRSAAPKSVVVTNHLIKRVLVKVLDYSDEVYGGDIIFPALKE